MEPHRPNQAQHEQQYADSRPCAAWTMGLQCLEETLEPNVSIRCHHKHNSRGELYIAKHKGVLIKYQDVERSAMMNLVMDSTTKRSLRSCHHCTLPLSRGCQPSTSRTRPILADKTLQWHHPHHPSLRHHHSASLFLNPFHCYHPTCALVSRFSLISSLLSQS